MNSAKVFNLSACFGILLVVALSFTACNDAGNENVIKFKNDFQRPWIGPEFWANPLQDWQVNNGRVECIVSGGDRNLFLLTRELDESGSGFRTSVNVGALSDDFSQQEGWIGFKIGVRGDYKDYRDNAVRGDGLPVGITTGGHLFIGRLDNDSKSIQPDWNGFQLELIVEDGSEELLSVLVAKNEAGEEIGRLEKNIKADWVIGGVALACSAGKVPETPEDRPEIMYGNWGFKEGTRRKGDVRAWFRDWRLSGEQLKEYPERSFGPVLWTQYTLSSQVVKMTAQMAPVGPDDDKLAYIDIESEGAWEERANAEIDRYSRIATFVLPDWSADEDIAYRIRYSCYTSGKEKNDFS